VPEGAGSALGPEIQEYRAKISGHSPDATSFAEIKELLTQRREGAKVLTERGCVRQHQPQRVVKAAGLIISTRQFQAGVLRLVCDTAALRDIQPPM